MTLAVIEKFVLPSIGGKGKGGLEKGDGVGVGEQGLPTAVAPVTHIGGISLIKAMRSDSELAIRWLNNKHTHLLIRRVLCPPYISSFLHIYACMCICIFI